MRIFIRVDFGRNRKYRPELCETICAELVSIDLSKYKDSMAPLIKKDIAKLQKAMG